MPIYVPFTQYVKVVSNGKRKHAKLFRCVFGGYKQEKISLISRHEKQPFLRILQNFFNIFSLYLFATKIAIVNPIIYKYFRDVNIGRQNVNFFVYLKILSIYSPRAMPNSK